MSDERAEDVAPATVDLETENKDLYDRLLRKQAEFENYRKRVEKEKGDIRQRARSAVVEQFLPVLDSCERGLQHLEETDGSDVELAKYREGLELIARQIRAAFDALGVREIPTRGQLFDPRYHEAVQSEVTQEHRDSEILEDIQKGYMLNDQLLRAAQVKVAVRKD